MAPTPVQSAVNSVPKYGPGDEGSVSLRTTFDDKTTPGSLLIAVAFITGGVSMRIGFSDSSFTKVCDTSLRDTQLVVWIKQSAASISSLSISIDAYRGATLRLYEYAGVAQSNALDKVVIASGENSSPNSGSTSTLAAAGELVFGVLGNQYAATQYGFSGGFSRQYETLIPDSSRQEWERGRITTHVQVAPDTSARRLTASLSTDRRWISCILTFRSGISGPARFTVTKNTTALIVDKNRANLTVFGPLKVTLSANRTALKSVEAVKARIGPFDYQYRLGGWSGLLIGAGTKYPIESIQGLEGWSVRTADDDQPRGDGALRGIDRQTARQILIKLSSPSPSGNRSDVEAQIAALYNALVPRTEDDEELIFRHPGRPLRTVYYRPTEVLRELSLAQALIAKQAITLKSVDPRVYSAITQRIIVPVATDDGDIVNVVAAVNAGNAYAYPLIRVIGPTSGPDVTRVALFNASADIAFEVDAVLQQKAELTGDMRASAVGGGAPIIAVSGQNKYGAWQMPRLPFFLAPNPIVQNGVNLLYVRTVPTGAPVTVTVEYRDTWSG